jgi:uncharacterized protein with PQ loop repeat
MVILYVNIERDIFLHYTFDTNRYSIFTCRKPKNLIAYLVRLISAMQSNDLQVIPYTATGLSILGRFIFMFLLYKNKSTNSLSLIFCILSIFSSGMWIYYSVQVKDVPLTLRSSTEATLLSVSAIYIIRNKVINSRIAPLPSKS